VAANGTIIRAIIFDLYGTLIFEADVADCFPRLAEAIGIELDLYHPARQKTVVDAMVGKLPDAEARARAILAALGRDDVDGLAARLAEIEREARWAQVRPYPATLPTLTTLRERGIPLGLVSDCTALMGRAILERVELLPFLDAVALSYEIGCAKPEAAIYRAAVDGLGVPPESCLYVGDGGSDELTGAAALGMTTVRIDQEGGFGRTAYPAPSDDVIVSLHELLDLPFITPGRPGFAPLDVAWVRPDLAVGGRIDPANLPRLRAMGMESIVDLRAEESDDEEVLVRHGLRFLHLPMPDEFPLTQQQMRDGSRWVAAERAAGRRVLVHCQHGVGRSVMLVAAVLHDEGDPMTEALQQIKARRPRMALNARQLAAVLAYGEGAGG